MKRFPFLLSPIPKDYLWGGSRLNDDFNLKLDSVPLAEAWVCSTHHDGASYVSAHECSLTELLKKNPEWLGTHPLLCTGGKPELPILIKLIDAKEDLSVQVHPDDDYALKNEGELGKTEMWYILDAKINSELVYGFNQDMNVERIRDALNKGSINQFLNHVSVHKDDLFYIEAGTVHAIGGGILLAEIQESSNITYRLYDYDRLDKYGEKRTLNVEKALKVANLGNSIIPRQPLRVIKYRNGSASELLTRCKYFQVERLIINTDIHREMSEFQAASNSFHALLCIDGCGVLFGEDKMLNFFKGDCIFVPADSISLRIHGKAQLLDVSC